MLISRTPFRISFFGGGTDFEDYFKVHGGCILSTTIDKYCYINWRDLPALFSYRNQFSYSKIERFNEPDEVEHPVIREAFRYYKIDRVQIAYDADLPARSGLGASSSFSVGLINSYYRYIGQTPDKMTLAKEAIYLERVLCREAGGVQDQLAAAFGGLNKMTFGPDGYEVKPVNIGPDRKRALNKNLMLFFTGFTRLSDEIARDQKQNIPKRLGELNEMKALTDEAEKILVGQGDLVPFGNLLNITWELKRTLSNKITVDYIDDAYKKALNAGAVGGKLLGAGGGGFLLFYVEEDARQSVMAALTDFYHIPFKFEDEGSKIIYEGVSNGE